MPATWLVTGSAAIACLLGIMHLAFTLFGHQLDPRDADLKQRMQATSMRISARTNLWRAWIGFNASHSLGLLLFGVVYGYLAMAQPALLSGSAVLAGAGGLMLLGLTVLARRYWFRTPFLAVLVALLLYLAGLASAAVI